MFENCKADEMFIEWTYDFGFFVGMGQVTPRSLSLAESKIGNTKGG